jgi:3-deoxy-D-manno-octulosonic-acid transferase
MIDEDNAARIRLLGAPQSLVRINGNAKYDMLIDQADPARQERFMQLFNLEDCGPVLVAGSTRNAEEEIILDAFHGIRRYFPDAVLIIAPRHVERAYQIEEIVKGRGLSCQLRTDLDMYNRMRTAPVLIIDTIGELQDIYSVASIVFCGGSLVPKGGHNIIEAAVWGKPVFFGPSMEDFLDARELLEKAGGGLEVHDAQEMVTQTINLLSHKAKAEAMGRAAKDAVLANRGALTKHADVVLDLLNLS